MDKIVMYYMYGYETCAKIEVQYTGKINQEPIVTVENYTDFIVKRPFGYNNEINYKIYKQFLEKRCFPRTRYNCKQLLNDISIGCYDSYTIIKHTHGVMSDDLFWIRFEGEEPFLWDSIMVR